MSAFWVLINSLPDLLKLIQALQEAAKKSETERQTKDDIKRIHEAFVSGDPSKLNDLFNH